MKLEDIIAGLSPLRRAALLQTHGLFKQAENFTFAATSDCVKLLSKYNAQKTINELYLDELKLCCKIAKIPCPGNQKARLVKALTNQIKSEENLNHPDDKQCTKLIKTLDKDENKAITIVCKTLKINLNDATNWLKSQGLYEKYCYRNNPLLKRRFDEKNRSRLFNKFFRLIKEFLKKGREIEDYSIIDFCEENNLTLSKFLKIKKTLEPIVREFLKEKKHEKINKDDWDAIVSDWYKSKDRSLNSFSKKQNLNKTRLMVFLTRTKE